AIAGVSVFLVWIARGNPGLAIALAGLTIIVCYVFGFHHQPYMTRADQSRSQMDQALEFIQTKVPAADPIFVDYQASLMVGYHLCRHRAPGEITEPGLHEFSCAGHRVIATSARVWMFTAETFPENWNELVRKYHLNPGSSAWVVHAGWGSSVIPKLDAGQNYVG